VGAGGHFGGAGAEGRKDFFFVKKKQKTFASCGVSSSTLERGLPSAAQFQGVADRGFDASAN
jgi:hypothetical protein